MNPWRSLKQRVAEAVGIPNVRSLGFLIQQFSERGLLGLGLQLHARLLVLSIVPENFLASKLISLYSRCSAHGLPIARLVFDAIPSKNLFSWNAMLLAYSSHGQTLPFLRLLSSMPPPLRPDAISLSSLLRSISSLSSSLAPAQVHAFAFRLGHASDLFVSNGLITAYSRSGLPLSARDLFDEIPQRDVVSWNSIICGYAHQGSYSACLQLFQEMRTGAEEVAPNAVTLAAALLACSRLRDLSAGIELHRLAADRRIPMDPVLRNSILALYARCGRLDIARQLFEEFPEPDAISYNTMISGYMSHGLVGQAMELFGSMPSPVCSTWNAVIAGMVQNNRLSCALELFREMQAAGFRPNSVTISTALPAVSSYSGLLKTKQAHCYAIRNGCDRSAHVGAALIDAYGKAGFLDGARRVFEGALGASGSVVVWTAIISACAAQGDAAAALSAFWRMLRVGVRPDPVTFTAVLSACAHAGEVEEARRIVHVLMPRCGIPPAVEQYACLVGALSRKGMLWEAAGIVGAMPFPPNAKMWGALLNGAAVFRDVEIGEHAFKRLLDLEPNNTGNFVVMANLFSQAGKWREAEEVREKMKGAGLGKIPGCSWIEVSGAVRVFAARGGAADAPHCEDLYLLIDALAGLMRAEEGYLAKEEMDDQSFSC